MKQRAVGAIEPDDDGAIAVRNLGGSRCCSDQRRFGSYDDFRTKFAEAATTQFGSGWCWLVKDKDGSLKVTKTENGVNPLCFGQTALLGCDVWEHSYYIDFRNKRPAYLTNFLEKLVNWENVASRL